jgi:type IX secretion system PorP/SprF family membrane protein
MKRGIFRIVMLGVIITAGNFLGHAQDPQYTQFYANQQMLNPAFTGAALGPRVAMNYRAQWASIPGSYRQTAIGYDQPLMFGKSLQGIGGLIQSDRAGEGNLSKINVTLNYSFAIQFGRRGHEQYLRFGLGGGIEQASLDIQKLRFSDQIDPREGFVRATNEVIDPNRGINPNVNFGVAYYNQYAWVGASVHNITEPHQTFITTLRDESTRLPRRITATAGLRIPVGPPNDPEKISISPALLFMTQRNFNQLNVGTYVNIEPMIFGLWWRTNYNNFNGDFVTSDMVAGLVGFKNGPFSVGYSYDYTVSGLTNGISGGSHEIALIVEWERDKPKTFRHRKLPCPRF